MSFRMSLIALVMVLGFAAPAKAEQLEKVAEFEFNYLNKPVLNIKCVVKGIMGCVCVETNTCTRLWVEYSDFHRVEKNCEGEPLKVVDIAEARLGRWFFEEKPCKDNAIGTPMSYKAVKDPAGLPTWIVESHTGGYEFCFHLLPRFECDDDAGYYTANAAVHVCTLPLTDEKLPAVICLK